MPASAIRPHVSIDLSKLQFAAQANAPEQNEAAESEKALPLLCGEHNMEGRTKEMSYFAARTRRLATVTRMPAITRTRIVARYGSVSTSCEGMPRFCSRREAASV